MHVTGVNGQVTLEGGMLTISRSGAMAKMTVGKGEKRIPVKSISAVEWKPASRLVRGFIEFSVPGGNEERSTPGRRTQDAARNENAVVFGFKQQAEFEALRAAVEAAIV